MPKETMVLETPEAAQQSQAGPVPTKAVATLEADRATHLRELDELRSGLTEPLETQIEEADPEVSEQAKNLALMHEIEDHVAEIDQAWAAAQRGQYGICEHCGQPIDPERLRILPETRLCVHCKSQLEKAEHHHKRK